MKTLDLDYLKATLRPRPYNAHKGSMGTLFAVCGSYGMAGAQILSANAALRSGVGMLRVAVVKSIYPIFTSAVPEAVCLPMAENVEGKFSAESLDVILENAEKADAVLLGCGLGACPDTEKITLALLTENKTPLVLDADGINCVSKHIDVLGKKSCPVILTPHPGEMSRLTGKTVGEIEASRQETAEAFSRKYSAVTVLKGADTIVTDGRQSFISYAGNPGMAVGGSGDVLAGITGAFLAQKYTPLESACTAVFAHGTAGDHARDELGEISMLPRDIPNYLKEVFKSVE